MEQKNKPIQMRIEEAKVEILNQINKTINSYNLDFYFLFGIIKDIFNEVDFKKNQELNDLNNEYQKITQESDNNGILDK